MTDTSTYLSARTLLNSTDVEQWRYFAHYLAGYDPDTFLHVADVFLRPDPTPDQLAAAHTEALALNSARINAGGHR